MTLTTLFLAELDREVPRSRKVLEQVPPDSRDWRPHGRSMAFGYLADLVATMPSWLALLIERDELDIAPRDEPAFRPSESRTRAEFLEALTRSAAQARKALTSTDDTFLQTPWMLLVAGRVMAERPRHEMIRDTINHWAHHRGQMTVYLRLMGAKVPSIYGPSADDGSVA